MYSDLRIRPCDWDDEERDGCGSRTEVVLSVNHVKIPLCADCLQNLRDELEEFDNTQFCYKCKYFKEDRYDRSSCMKPADMTDSQIGSRYCVDKYDEGRWCEHKGFEPKTELS